MYLIQRETTCLSECDNSQLLNHGRRKLASSPARADRRDQAFLLVETQCVGRNSRAFDDLSDIHFQPIDLKLTSTSIMHSQDKLVHEQEVCMALPEEVAQVFLLGVGATVVMDLWMFLLKALGVPALNFAFVGRWVGHVCQGTFAHASIGQAMPVRGEVALGWVAHYVTGIAFAVLLVCIQGVAWLQEPTFLPAIAVGFATVAVPLFVIQPAMGAGFAFSRTPTPARNCVRSVISHSVFGIGLYLCAVVIALAST